MGKSASHHAVLLPYLNREQPSQKADTAACHLAQQSAGRSGKTPPHGRARMWSTQDDIALDLKPSAAAHAQDSVNLDRSLVLRRARVYEGKLPTDGAREPKSSREEEWPDGRDAGSKVACTNGSSPAKRATPRRRATVSGKRGRLSTHFSHHLCVSKPPSTADEAQSIRRESYLLAKSASNLANRSAL